MKKDKSAPTSQNISEIQIKFYTYFSDMALGTCAYT